MKKRSFQVQKTHCKNLETKTGKLLMGHVKSFRCDPKSIIPKSNTNTH